MSTTRRDLFSAAAAAGLAGAMASTPARADLATPAASASAWQGQGATTPLAADTVLTRIGFGSCLRQDRPAPILDALAKDAPQLFLMIGDNIYGDVRGQGGEDPELNSLLAAYAGLAIRADWQRFRAANRFHATWDDHDFGENDAGATFPWEPRTRDVFHAFWGSSVLANQKGHAGVYGSTVYGPEGRRVQVILLDTRTFRSDLTRAEPAEGETFRPYVPDTDPAKTMLGAEQWAWLEGELREPAELRLVISSIQAVALTHPFEKWANLPRERERLFGLIAATGANGVVMLSGDRHRGLLSIETEGVPYPIHDLTSSALNQPSRTRGVETDRTSQGDYFTEANAGDIRIDWQTGTVTLALVDQTGARHRETVVPLASLRA